MVTEVDSKNFEKEVKKSNIPVIIDFFADWCGPCQMMKPVFDDISKDYAGKLKFVKLDTEKSPELAQEFSIMGIPCLVIAKEGKEVDRITGFMQKDMLKEKIDEILEKI